MGTNIVDKFKIMVGKGQRNLEKFKHQRKIMEDAPAVIDARKRMKDDPSFHNKQNIYTEQHRVVPYWTAHREFFKDIGYSITIVILIGIIVICIV